MRIRFFAERLSARDKRIEKSQIAESGVEGKIIWNYLLSIT